MAAHRCRGLRRLEQRTISERKIMNHSCNTKFFNSIKNKRKYLLAKDIYACLVVCRDPKARASQLSPEANLNELKEKYDFSEKILLDKLVGKNVFDADDICFKMPFLGYYGHTIPAMLLIDEDDSIIAIIQGISFPLICNSGDIFVMWGNDAKKIFTF